MQDSRPSATAYRVALRRATHQLLDQPLILEDKLALQILGPDTKEKITGDPEKHQTPISRGLRAFVSARSRYAEDKLADAVSLGVRQYVLLGAGLDTFAYRNPYPELRIFEVDHPATQEWKRAILERAQISIPSLLSFTAVDFERDNLKERLNAAGFRTDEAALFAWLGVTPYLSLETFRSTLQFLGSLPTRTGVVFDYGLSSELLTPRERLALEYLSQKVEAAGEPFRLFFAPSGLQEELRNAGFNKIEDLSGADIRNLYFVNRPDGLTVGNISRIASAWKL